jgi:hypothetical protein
MNSVSTNWPFEKLSTYLLIQILEGYCPDRNRVGRAMAILDAQDAPGEAVDSDLCERRVVNDDGSWRAPEPFQPTEADWNDYALWSDRLETLRALEDAHRAAEWQAAIERGSIISDEDIPATGLPVG